VYCRRRVIHYSATNCHQVSPANTLGPPFTTHGTNPFPRPSHPRSRASLHLDSSEQPLPSHANLAWENVPPIPTAVPQQYPDHTTGALASSNLISNSGHQTHSAATSWPIVETDEAAAGPSNFHRVQDEGQQWSLVQTQPDHASYAHQTQPQHHVSASALALGFRRPSTRRKVAKVPSSFVERQEKLKISKRRGPLQEKQREKTHTMRKTKRICVRCRFYKSGVSLLDTCNHTQLMSAV
jgi:hypothetical protein